MPEKIYMSVKQLILWRHAEAELPAIGQTDMSRALTNKGVTQAAEMACWLNKHLPKETLVLISPAERTKQTARALRAQVHVLDSLSPDTRYETVLAYLNQSKVDSLMLVGHQPWIGQLIAHLLGFAPGEISVKKGAVWWLRLSSDGLHYKVHVVQTPQMLV